METLFWPLLILFAGIVLMILEIFVPSGGVLGILSGIGILASVVAAFSYGGLRVGTAFMAGVALLIPVLVYLAVKWWPKTPLGKKMLIQTPPAEALVTERRRSQEQWIGQLGLAVTPLLPAGVIRIGETSLDVISDGMTIEKGATVKVVAVRGTNLVVHPSSAEVAEASQTTPQDPVSEPMIPDPFDDSVP